MNESLVISLFDCPQKIKLEFKIWEQFSNLLFQSDSISFHQDCYRISKSQRIAKPLTIYLGIQTLYYFKKGIQKGMLTLNLVMMKTMMFESKLIIRLSRDQKTLDLLVEGPEKLQQLLAGKCLLSSFHEDYHVEKKIGNGSQAIIFQAIQKSTNQRFAVKGYNKLLIQAKERLENKIKVMRNLEHVNLLHLYEVHETQNTVYLVVDLLRGGDLSQRMTKIIYTEGKLQQLMYNILKALNYMHQKRIMHRDIKPQNILLKSKENDIDIVLADFGLAMSLDQQPIIKRCGTPGFIAPEVLNYEQNTNFYNEKCDIFSTGIIFYMLVTGINPFKGIDQATILELNQKCCINFDIKQICKAPKSLQSLMSKMLRVNPQTRYSAEKCLQHEYFKEIYQENQVSLPISQIMQQVFESDERDYDNFELITQEQQWNGNAETLGSITKLSPKQSPQQNYQSLATLSRFSQFCIDMEAFNLNQAQSPKKKANGSLYKTAIKNAQQQGTQDDNLDVQAKLEINKRSLFFKKSNSLNV